MLRKTLSQISWLRIFYSLLFVTGINIILAFHFLTPPIENEPTVFWPIVFYSKLIVPLILFLPLGFLFTVGVYFFRKQWMAAFASFLVLIVVTYVAFVGFLFSGSFALVGSVENDHETLHLGAVGNLDGGIFLVFCREQAGKGTCDYFFTQYWVDSSPELKLGTESEDVVVILEDTMIYQYNGRFPGRCVETAEELVSGSCGSYFHGGNSGR